MEGSLRAEIESCVDVGVDGWESRLTDLLRSALPPSRLSVGTVAVLLDVCESLGETRDESVKTRIRLLVSAAVLRSARENADGSTPRPKANAIARALLLCASAFAWLRFR